MGFWNDNFKQWPLFTDNNICDNEEAKIFFNFDIIKDVETPWLHPMFEEKVISETGTKQILDCGTMIAEVRKDNLGVMPRFIRSTIQTPDDWKRMKEDRFDRDDPARKIDIEALKKLHPADRSYPLSVHTGSMIGKVRDLLTFEGLAYANFDYPDMVEDMIETHCVLIEDFLDQVLGHIEFDLAWGYEDICFKSGPIVTVDFFKSVIVPRYKRLSKRLRAHGVDVWFVDCDGDVRPLLPLFMEGGFNGLYPFEVNGSGHPAELLEEYGKDLLIMGGFDKMALGEGPEAIKKYMESLVSIVERGGYIPYCDHAVPPNVKPEDFLYYQDLKEEMFGMK